MNKFISSEKGAFSIKISENNSTGYKVKNSSLTDNIEINTVTF